MGQSLATRTLLAGQLVLFVLQHEVVEVIYENEHEDINTKYSASSSSSFSFPVVRAQYYFTTSTTTTTSWLPTCFPLKASKCPKWYRTNPPTFGAFARNASDWPNHQPPRPPVHRFLSDCVEDMFGVILRFPLPSKRKKYEITWASGPLILPFPRDVTDEELKVASGDPTVFGGYNRFTACNPLVQLVKYEMDPQPDEPPEEQPTFNIGPLPDCTPQRALEQCCWIECGYYVFHMASKRCFFAVENMEIPELPKEKRLKTTFAYQKLLKNCELDKTHSDSCLPFQIFRIRRKLVESFEEEKEFEAANPTSMLSFGGLEVSQAVAELNIDDEFERHRLFAGMVKKQQPCRYCPADPDKSTNYFAPFYNEETKEMTRMLVWDADVILPILDMLNFTHFDDWVLHGNYTHSRPDLNQIKRLSIDEIENRTRSQKGLDELVDISIL